MHHALKLIAVAALALVTPVVAHAESKVTAPGGTTSGTYMDYMKTVYNRAGSPELIMLPLTAFDSDYNLQPMGAKSWKQSADGLTWTFTLQDGLVWSDGTPLTAGDYVFALQRAAKEGYDFNWYWSFAGGIKGWSDVTDKKADVSVLGLKAVVTRLSKSPPMRQSRISPVSPASGTRSPSTSSTSSAMTTRSTSILSSRPVPSWCRIGKSPTTP